MIEGMKCEHCANFVKKALQAVDGVESAAVDLRLSIFGSGLETDQVSIPNPTADPYNTVKTASAAIRQKLPDCQLIAVVDGEGLTSEEVSIRIQGAQESCIERYVVVYPALG